MYYFAHGGEVHDHVHSSEGSTIWLSVGILALIIVVISVMVIVLRKNSNKSED